MRGPSTTSNRSRPQRQVAPRTRTGRALAPARRAPSTLATRALESFTRLYAFFGQDVLVADALGWDEATVAAWRRREVVRPHVKKAAQVELLLELCEETRPYLREDRHVGEWVSTGLPNLRGSSPSQWLAARGHRGLRELTYGLVDWMPRLPAGEIEPIDESAASKALAAAGTTETAEFLRMLDELD